ncbi:MAG: NAD(P)-dependent oxidoreductase [Anaerolineales bacterium]
MRIVVTGARGLIGKPTALYCQEQGADVLSVDSVGRPGPGEYAQFITAELTDLGQVYDVLHGADVVIHLAAIAAQRVYPAAHTFMNNVGMTWNVLEAAARLGIKRVVIASSVQVNHTVTPRTPIKYEYFPVDEQHPVSPQEDYSIGKLVGEVIADGFAHHWGLTVVSIRFPMVARPEVFAQMPVKDNEWPNAALYAYCHVQDAARACYLAATAPLPPNSHTVLLVAAKDSCVDMPTREYAKLHYPEAELRPTLSGYDSLLNSSRAKEVIGWEPEYSLKR